MFLLHGSSVCGVKTAAKRHGTTLSITFIAERTYVSILHLIDQVFHFRVDQENRVQQMFPPETITQMFCNIKSLFKLHSEHLLPQ